MLDVGGPVAQGDWERRAAISHHFKDPEWSAGDVL